MAIRYSGDTEIRFGYDKRNRVYRGTVRDPRKRWKGFTSIFWFSDPYDSRAYDKAAISLLHLAERNKGHFDVERKNGKIILRRVFQSPCPKGMMP